MAEAQPAREEEPLNFERERDERSTSWERADPRGATIERFGRYGFRVRLPNGDPHFCALGVEPGGQYRGWCKCKGFRHHDGPCAHLCTLRKAEFGNVPDLDGEPVRIHEVAELKGMIDAEHAHAQQTGEVFGGEQYLQKLSPRQRECFKACVLGDYSQREYAAARGWESKGTVSKHLTRAKEKLEGSA